MHNFARRKTSGQERTLRFVSDLTAAQRQHLPECPSVAAAIITAKARSWRTIRLRPEVLSVLDGLMARSRKHLGEGELSLSEVMAALILAGLPKVSSQLPFNV
ncbi:hypothetical protein SAMN05216227_10814 [Pseudorhodobacter antarcticus]|uniref:Uncharacterized protein n=1 Tax=Pseudorhodobacter antarcticus TaxID=1077947 RepID=A0A1H8NEL5_9RHOB|nr:hypothetical protein [Pseudorhodobacter antarcticus]SEO28171.1 hypothetical protein SAMN05216227_10814 [Pseudorhodobacter antarcticus]